MAICFIKSPREIKSMREGGRILETIMKELSAHVVSGNTTLELDKLAQELVFAYGGIPSFKGYKSSDEGKTFPATLCASLNCEIVHGVPSGEKVLKSGDVLKIDIGMKYDGMHTDMARTVIVGKATAEAKKLVKVTEQSFWEGVKKMAPGKYLNEYCRTVEAYVKKNGFSVVRDLVGHGIGKNLHEYPNVPNYYDKKFKDIILRSGMTFALEPMVNAGSHKTKINPDGWTFETADGNLSSHYENTVVITENGAEVLTCQLYKVI